MRFYIPIGKHVLGINFHLNWSFRKQEGYEAVGIGNKMDHRYCVFLDYDYNELTTLTSEIKGLQKNYNLGNAYLFSTGKGFHVIFLDLVTYQELKVIMNASTCDYHYKVIGRKNCKRQWVLRFTDKGKNKITFHSIIKSQSDRMQSFPHSNYLIAQGVPIKEINKQDLYYEGRDMPLTFVRYSA